MTEYETMYYRESIWSKRASWQYRFCWFPRKCHISGRPLWLKMAYCGTLGFAGPGEPEVEFRWHDMNEHLIWLLKG